MRARAVVALSAAAFAGVGACVDLFHSTRDIVTACKVDSSAPGCGADASAPAAADSVGVCAATSALARQQADHACAWLGACEGPMGRNAFGTCSLQARAAYDCASSPNRRATGAVLKLWSCLRDAASCADVEVCVFDAPAPACPEGGPIVTCTTSGSDAEGGNTGEVLVACDGDGGPALAENCAMGGQTCSLGGPAGAACTGAGGFECDGPACVGGRSLRWCPSGTPSRDLGMDCTDNGAGRCEVFDAGPSPWATCVAEGTREDRDDAATSCAPTLDVTCNAEGVASACPSGVPETVDCATLLGYGKACQTGALSPPFDWTSACAITPPMCTADTCDDAGTTLLGCAGGVPLPLDCGEAGLGACSLFGVPDGDGGTVLRPACALP